jgi:hypothetical protein
MLTDEKDYSADGDVEEAYIYTYDGNGNVLTKIHERGFGAPDLMEVYTYDVYGNLLTEEYSYVDRESAYLVNTYTYDCWE